MAMNAQPIAEEKAVFMYLVNVGFSKRKASKLIKLDLEYKMALKAMKYNALKTLETTVDSGGLKNG